jgi:hypothetical protein
MRISPTERVVDPGGEREPGLRRFGMHVTPGVDEIVPEVQVTEMVESLGEGRERNSGAQGQEALEDVLVARARNGTESVERGRTRDLSDAFGRESEGGVDRLVQRGQNENDRVDVVDVEQEEHHRTARVQESGVMIVGERGLSRLHAGHEHALHRCDLGLATVSANQGTAQRVRHLGRTAL